MMFLGPGNPMSLLFSVPNMQETICRYRALAWGKFPRKQSSCGMTPNLLPQGTVQILQNLSLPLSIQTGGPCVTSLSLWASSTGAPYVTSCERPNHITPISDKSQNHSDATLTALFEKLIAGTFSLASVHCSCSLQDGGCKCARPYLSHNPHALHFDDLFVSGAPCHLSSCFALLCRKNLASEYLVSLPLGMWQWKLIYKERSNDQSFPPLISLCSFDGSVLADQSPTEELLNGSVYVWELKIRLGHWGSWHLIFVSVKVSLCFCFVLGFVGLGVRLEKAGKLQADVSMDWFFTRALCDLRFLW